MVTKAKKSVKRRAKALEPAGLLNGGTRWIPYVQRLSYVPTLNSRVAQFAQVRPANSTKVLVMNPSLTSTRLKTNQPTNSSDTTTQTTPAPGRVIATQTTPVVAPLEGRQEYRHMPGRALFLAHGMFADPQYTTSGDRLRPGALDALALSRGVSQDYNREMLLQDLRFEARTDPFFVDRTSEYSDDIISASSTRARPSSKLPLTVAMPASSSRGVSFE